MDMRIIIPLLFLVLSVGCAGKCTETVHIQGGGGFVNLISKLPSVSPCSAAAKIVGQPYRGSYNASGSSVERGFFDRRGKWRIDDSAIINKRKQIEWGK
jgi:hypothetical protein